LNFTASQQSAITASGNVLVMAGAGTGKTRTLVERAARRLLNPQSGVSLDEVLMVTFTEAAAAEIRQRIRARLEEELERQPNSRRLSEQLALLDTAHICTLHSFCFELVRQHFFELGLDPQLKVLDEDQARLLASESLDELLRMHYEASTPASEDVLRLIQDYAAGWDVPIRELVLRLHEYTQTQPDPEGWFTRQLSLFSQTEPGHWRQWLDEGFADWCERWLPVLRGQPLQNSNARQCAEVLQRAASRTGSEHVERLNDVLSTILAADRRWPTKKKKALRKPLEKFFEEAAFLASLTSANGQPDPLIEDWSWVRQPMITLLELARQFGKQFADAKREAGTLDFHDLEQFALRLLWDSEANQPTALAQRWRDKLELVFVDEYQDINAAQDCILTSVSRDGEASNRFLVGDVKQSIYRFRQAAPQIFQEYAHRWRSSVERGQVIDLQDNFRSHESVLNFVNPLFGALMRPALGRVEFDDRAVLKFGDPTGRAALSAGIPELPRVELNLLLKEKRNTGADEEVVQAELSDTEREARCLARRLLALRSSGHQIWDNDLKQRRPVEWNDMVILLRSPRNSVESFAKEFHRLGIPLQAKRSGFFDNIEVLDLLNLLRLLDNPLQDIPAIAVLRSPLVGLSLDELAAIRLTVRKGRFWTALLRWHEVRSPKVRSDVPGSGSDLKESTAGGKRPEVEMQMWEKVDTFVTRFFRWRTASRHASLSHRLEMVLNETGYLDWILTQTRGEQGQANVQQLLQLARQFDGLQQQGLHYFLKLIDSFQDTVGDREPAPIEARNAVRLMSIHQSKGLEFPVVVVAGLGKRFNFSDTTASVLLDERFGLCPQVKPPNTGLRYPSLPYWLARQRQRSEMLGEELRILYVALTRAQELLILAGSTSRSAAEEWAVRDQAETSPHTLLKARSYLDWLGPWLAARSGMPNWILQPSGHAALWQWRIVSDEAGLESQSAYSGQTTHPDTAVWEETSLAALCERLQWSYPRRAATIEPAKTSVTAVRRKLADEADEEAVIVSPLKNADRFASRIVSSGKLTPEEIGNAHHRYLQLVALGSTGSVQELREEANRLERGGLLKPAEAKALDLEAISRFWASELGQQILARADTVRREWPFTARLGHNDLETIRLNLPIPEGEFLVMQGVIDLAVVLPDEIWLVDFKTDQFAEAELEAKVGHYAPQLRLYALALERICRQPVTQRWLHFLRLNRTVAVR
jgi:ATP-dependent helicase/nuclease subunit A